MAEPDKLPLAVGPDQHADEVGTEHALLEKYAWQQDRALQFHPTFDLKRLSKSGADAATHQKGTWTPQSGLTSIPCWHDELSLTWQRRFGATEKIGDKVFVFYETTNLTSLAVNDQILFDSDLYDIVDYHHDTDSGRFEVVGRLVKG